MSKKRLRKVYISKGLRKNVSSSITNLLRRERNPFDTALNVLAAWRAGRNPWVTIPNPNNAQTNMRFVKVRANSYYGDPKKSRSNLFGSKVPA